MSPIKFLIDEPLRKRLENASIQTGIPQAVFIRRGVDKELLEFEKKISAQFDGELK